MVFIETISLIMKNKTLKNSQKSADFFLLLNPLNLVFLWNKTVLFFYLNENI
jgi:hypothetical protein